MHLAGRAAQNSSVVLEFHGPFLHSAQTRLELTALALQLEVELGLSLREQHAAVYSVDVSKKWSEGAYTLRVSFDCAPSDVELLRKATWEVIGTLRSGQVSEAAVEALRARLRERFARSSTSAEHWAEELAASFAHNIPARDILAVTELSAGLTAKSLGVTARRYLRSDRYLDALWSPRPPG